MTNSEQGAKKSFTLIRDPLDPETTNNRIYDCILQNYTDAKQLVAQCRHYSPCSVIHPLHFPTPSTQFTGDSLETAPRVRKGSAICFVRHLRLRLNFLSTVFSTDAGVFFPFIFLTAQLCPPAVRSPAWEILAGQTSPFSRGERGTSSLLAIRRVKRKK